MQAVSSAQQTREVKPFEYWSNHKRDWKSGEWKKIPREWKKNEGWRVLIPGEVKAPLIAANLSTLMSAAGTDYFPDIKDKILLLESMSAGFATEERHLRQLQLMGVFDGILGLIIGKPEWPDSQGAMFSHNDLILEVVGKSRGYPIVSEFDCSHTVPMLTFAQMTMVSLKSQGDWDVRFEVLEAMVI
jgi:muramoyltetrapeptide carboxypeptidase LdcA involved in peptidoglycan recycling